MPANPVSSTTALLTYYSFDLGESTVEEIVSQWLSQYPPKWVIAAVVEAIYQGRYKTTSVDNILNNWSIAGQTQHHFDIEFADLICGKIFKEISKQVALSIDPLSSSPNFLLNTSPQPALANLDSSELNPAVSAKTAHLSFKPSKAANPGINRWLKLSTRL